MNGAHCATYPAKRGGAFDNYSHVRAETGSKAHVAQMREIG